MKKVLIGIWRFLEVLCVFWLAATASVSFWQAINLHGLSSFLLAFSITVVVVSWVKMRENSNKFNLIAEWINLAHQGKLIIHASQYKSEDPE